MHDSLMSRLLLDVSLLLIANLIDSFKESDRIVIPALMKLLDCER